MNSTKIPSIDPTDTFSLGSITSNTTMNSISPWWDTGVYTTTVGQTTTGINTWSINSDDLFKSWSPDAGLNVQGPAEFKKDVQIEGDLKVGGISIKESLLKIEERLHILRHNEKLELRSEELRELGEKYRKLEKEILYMDEVYEKLKS